MHIDDFIDKPIRSKPDNRDIRYAQWWFNWKRMPAYMERNFAEFYEHAKLFCIYQGNKYRVTGASRMGDVWLAKDHGRDHGYDLRVNVDECGNWSES